VAYVALKLNWNPFSYCLTFDLQLAFLPTSGGMQQTLPGLNWAEVVVDKQGQIVRKIAFDFETHR
jgi:hypothetical protein